MDIEKATVLFFSGTGTTEAYARAFAEGLPFDAEVLEVRHDAAMPEAIGPHELLALAVPVYAGWAPPFVWEKLENLRGEKTPTVIMAVYGARDYDSALYEMDAKLREKGFVTIGAAALVARHSVAQEVASDRPDACDLDEVRAFAKEVADRLRGLDNANQWPPYSFKHYEVDLNPHVYPVTGDECTMCGTCAAACPVGAIPPDAPNTIDQSICASCLRCIEVCPANARHLPDGLAEKCAAMLKREGADPDKPNEFF
ncbi:EFR1 family ferrodoxin [Adlercreutzia equolifaciens]|uniref:EFR1 family ferrodoxin n=1 Tax=Adlercreutzia equolifaciens TaxID=446660 RepID=UPI003521B31C